LALDASVFLEPNGRSFPLEQYLKLRPVTQLITSLDFDLSRLLAYSEIARTPVDTPLVCLAIAGVREGEGIRDVRVTVGGAGQPLATKAAKDIEESNRKDVPATYEFAVEWVDDVRAKADYRRAMAPILLKRALEDLWAEVVRAD
jgi:CO/xanthine dehydrogenase FAD-binding subunit